MFRINSDATVNHTQVISNGVGGLPPGTTSLGDRFGIRISGYVGDVDDDGLNDVLVADRSADAGGTDFGALFVLFMKGDDTVRGINRISQATGEGLDAIAGSPVGLGLALCVLPPASPSGNVADVMLGSASNQVLLLFPLDLEGQVGGVVRTIADGQGGLPSGSIATSSGFGVSAAAIGDADGDGVTDVAVGANADDTGGTISGAVYILYMAAPNTTGPVRDYTKLTRLTNGLGGVVPVSGTMRAGAANADFDGDGRVDLVLGIPSDNTGGANRGAIAVAFMEGALASASPTPSATPSVSPSASVSPSPTPLPVAARRCAALASRYAPSTNESGGVIVSAPDSPIQWISSSRLEVEVPRGAGASVGVAVVLRTGSVAVGELSY